MYILQVWNKYGNTRGISRRHAFDSKREGPRGGELRLLGAGREIGDLAVRCAMSWCPSCQYGALDGLHRGCLPRQNATATMSSRGCQGVRTRAIMSSAQANALAAWDTNQECNDERGAKTVHIPVAAVRLTADKEEIRKTAREAELEEQARRSMRYFVGNYRKYAGCGRSSTGY